MTTMLSTPDLTSKLTEHELASVVGFVCARFPQHSRDRGGRRGGYGLSTTVRARERDRAPIPLTVNRSLRTLRQSTPVVTVKRPSPPVSA